ncbi:MAG TPA: sterol desaturase family protein [Nitrospira sp.]|nr:sterol desaturase family protein [Nitrospira sp.]
MFESIQWFFQRAAEYSLASFSSWESFTAALTKVPRIFTDFSHGFAWPYLLSSLVVVWVLFVLTKRSGRMHAVSFREFAFPGRLYRHPSTRLDCRFVAIDIVLFFLLYVPIITGINLFGCKIMSALIVGSMSWEPPNTLSPASAVGAAIGFLMLGDLINYCTHVCFHRVPMLWSIHRIHHSAEVLTPVTAYRVHPLELIGFALCNAPAIGLASVFYQNIVGPPLQVATIFGISIIGLVGSHLRHSHILFSFGPRLSRIVLSPAQHVIHHSIDAKHWNKNFGVKFAFWDSLFGTLYVPSGNEPVTVGLQEPEVDKFRTVGDLYLRPFRDIFADRTLPAERRV